jgi:hypothetical protein
MPYRGTAPVAPQHLLGRAGEESPWEEARHEASGSSLALFTRVRGRGILGSLYPAVCKERLVGSTEEPFAPLLCIEVNATCLSSAWISDLVNGTGSSTRRWKSLVGTSPPRFCGPSRACHNWSAKEPATRNPPTLDPSLTLTRTQCPAIVGKRGTEESLIYAGFANPCNAQQPLTAHS